MKIPAVIGALAFAGVAAFGSSVGTIQVRAAQQSPMCLHGDDESAEQLARRQRALGFTRHINTIEATAASSTSSYQPADRLTITESLPSGFELRLSAAGRAYAFSVVDASDPCRFGYFSDDRGIIYRGEVIRGGRL
jgi:hypothetical protein